MSIKSSQLDDVISTSMFGFISVLVDWFAPIFLVLSPITSYADQIFSIHKSKSSDGFSLDIPLIMLVASILKFFYWFGARYSLSLFFQACLMIVMQVILLKVALDNRSTSAAQHTPFSNYSTQGMLDDIVNGKRPMNFWRWGNARPYYLFLAYLAGSLLIIQILIPPLAYSSFYITFLGYFGLAVEAILPVPQILKNHSAKSCKGFRPSVILNWVAGDCMKMSYFFLSTEYIPWPFKLCGIFQACCDSYLAYQFFVYGSGTQGLGYDMTIQKPTKGWNSSNT